MPEEPQNVPENALSTNNNIETPPASDISTPGSETAPTLAPSATPASGVAPEQKNNEPSTTPENQPNLFNENTPHYPAGSLEKDSHRFFSPRIFVWLVIILIISAIWYFGRGQGSNYSSGGNENVNIKVSDEKESGEVKIVNEQGQTIVTTSSVQAGAEEKVKVVVFYPNNLKTPGMPDCGVVFPLEREVAKKFTSNEVNAIIALLTSLSAADRTAGFFSAIPVGTRLLQISVKDGAATVNLTGPVASLAGSCAVSSARAQLERTLEQFPGISAVKICVDGRCDDVLQP